MITEKTKYKIDSSLQFEIKKHLGNKCTWISIAGVLLAAKQKIITHYNKERMKMWFIENCIYEDIQPFIEKWDEFFKEIKQSFDIWIISNRPQLAKEAALSLAPYETKIYNDPEYKCFSRAVNTCIVNSENETIIICNDKVRAGFEYVDKIIALLEQGFGIVGLYRFGFFGFKKDFIRKIGFFDERYIPGEYEDNDIIVRTKEANIAHYMSEEIDYVYLPSTHNINNSLDSISRKHFFTKWSFNLPNSITRLLPEEVYKYNIGDYKDSKFLPFNRSIMCKYSNEEWITSQMLNSYDKK